MLCACTIALKSMNVHSPHALSAHYIHERRNSMEKKTPKQIQSASLFQHRANEKTEKKTIGNGKVNLKPIPRINLKLLNAPPQSIKSKYTFQFQVCMKSVKINFLYLKQKEKKRKEEAILNGCIRLCT